MAELADAEASNVSVLSGVRVRVPLRAPLSSLEVIEAAVPVQLACGGEPPGVRHH